MKEVPSAPKPNDSVATPTAMKTSNAVPSSSAANFRPIGPPSVHLGHRISVVSEIAVRLGGDLLWCGPVAQGLEALTIKGVGVHRRGQDLDVARVLRPIDPILRGAALINGLPVVPQLVGLTRSSVHHPRVTVDEDADVVTDHVRGADRRSTFEVTRFERLAARREPEVAVNEESVDRGTSRLAALGDRRHDHVAHADEVPDEVGGREATLGRDDLDEVGAG